MLRSLPLMASPLSRPYAAFASVLANDLLYRGEFGALTEVCLDSSHYCMPSISTLGRLREKYLLSTATRPPFAVNILM
jgi:hypothetical protein